ncbi:magnesium-dependent phosphatase-1 [Vararia minispora EC-137]|uniref:Magnesium-dependent phosphatase-1 n=1 Tax=Vararia minispora EC-137 TaxID=1314806 RepID=A0ACB8QLI6_9AGAM|nr:magnesium-dependent phosphatase-1 [Vararia minispora EC-137]
MTSRLPKLVAFDLDYTLWPLWMDTHVAGPLKRDESNPSNEIQDRYGEKISFYRDVSSILHRLREAGIVVAACSRTSAPRLARNALSLLLVPPKHGDQKGIPTPAIEFFDQQEIYPGSKIQHFKQLHKKTGIPYGEMLFFDDEGRNREVESLGVTFILVSDGLHNQDLERGLNEWRRRHPMEVNRDASGDHLHDIA